MTQDPGGSDLLRRFAERRVRIQSALTSRIGRCGGVSAQIAPDRVPGDAQASGDLAQRDLVAKMPASNDAQYGHVDHSDLPLVAERDSVLYVGQHSMQKPTSGGSGFGANQQQYAPAGHECGTNAQVETSRRSAPSNRPRHSHTPAR